MKKFLVTFVLLLSVSFGWAQGTVGSWSLIPKVGVNFANISGFDVTVLDNPTKGFEGSSGLKSKYLEGHIIGLDVQNQITERVAASAGLFYSRQGMDFPEFESIDDKNVHHAFNGFQWKFHYLQLPVMLHDYVLSGLSFNAGLQIGYLLSAKGFSSQSRFYTDKEGKTHYEKDEEGNLLYDYKSKYDMTDNMKRIDVSVPVGISYEYGNVLLDARYNFGLLKINKDEYSTYKNKVFSFTVGYTFDL